MLKNVALHRPPRFPSTPWLILRSRTQPHRQSLRRRWYASSKRPRPRNPYPFPTVTDPTPYQIFHLMPDASPSDVKHRYYELVRLYHPDSAESRSREPDASRRHTQFSAITRAYSRLQKRPAGENWDADGAEGVVAGMNPWGRAPSMHRKRYDEPRFVDDRWKDRFLWGILGFSFVTIAAQTLAIRRQRFQDVADHVHAGNPMPFGLNTHARTSGSDEDLLKLGHPKRSE